MLIQKAFKYQLKPKPEQTQLIEKMLGCCRFVYNKMLGEQKQLYEKTLIEYRKEQARQKAIQSILDENKFCLAQNVNLNPKPKNKCFKNFKDFKDFENFKDFKVFIDFIDVESILLKYCLISEKEISKEEVTIPLKPKPEKKNRIIGQYHVFGEPFVHFNYNQSASLLVSWKKEEEMSWLKEASSQSLQQAIKHLESGFKRFNRHQGGFPHFKKKNRQEGVKFLQRIKLEESNHRIKLPKLGWVRYINSRKIEGKIKNVTLTKKCGKYYISIQTEFEKVAPVHQGKEIGLDMGIARTVTLSDGTYFTLPIESIKRYQTKIKKLQKKAARKIKFSQNWKKVNLKIAKLSSFIIK